LASGRFANGHWLISIPLNCRNIFSLSAGVKPFLVPNNSQFQNGNPPFVISSTGAINTAANSFIGETITLTSACRGNSCSNPKSPGPGEYLPMLLPDTHRYCPNSSSQGCSGLGSSFQASTECCDGTTFDYQQCGVSGTVAAWDPNRNPGGPNRAAQQALQCLIHDPQQDTLNPTFANNGLLQIQAGPFSQARYNVAPGSLIATSDSIVTVPLFDVPSTWPPAGQQVNIVGFLQLFVISTGPGQKDMNAYILNVIGCGSTLTAGSTISGGGASAIPVRLIHN
jgi:hypothetical protein